MPRIETTATSPADSRAPPIWIYPAALFAYGGLFCFGYATAKLAGGLAPFWLSAGLGIWLVLRFGGRMVFVIFLGGLPAYYAMAGFSLAELRGVGLVAATSVGRALAAYCGAWLWRRGQERWQKQFGRFFESINCVIVALASAVVAATVGSGVAVLLGYRTLAGGYDLWRPWVAGDVVGVLFSLPLLLSAPVLASRLRNAGARDLARGAVVLVAAVGVSWLVFECPGGIQFLCVLFPVLLVATVWFEALGARLVAFLFACVIIFAAVRGHGPFVAGGFWYSDLTLQLLLLVVGLVALLLPGVHAQRSLLHRLPLVLLLGGWTVGGVMFALVHRQQESTNAADFALLSDNARTAIEQRLTTYIDELHTGASFVAVSPTLGRAAWDSLADSLRLPERYPGIQSIAVVYPVPREATATFLQRVRADGAPEFAIHAVPGAPGGGGEQFVVTHLAPLAGNEPALGLDLATEANRRRAAEAARDTGLPQITGRITLVQDKKHRPGFLLVLPVYQSGAPVTTVAERRAALRAWVDAPFITESVMQGVLGSRREKLRLAMFYAGPFDAAHLFYSTDPLGPDPLAFARMNSLKIGGQEFKLGWNVGPGFVQYRQSTLMWLTLSLGVLTVLLAEVVLSLQAYREQAEELARHHLAAQRESEARFQAIFEQAAMGVTLIDLATGRYVRANQRFCRILGYAVDEMLRLDFRTITHPDDVQESTLLMRRLVAREMSEFSIEKRYLHKDGHVVWCRLTASVMTADGAMVGFGIGTLEDITDRKQAEEEISRTAREWQTTFDASGDAIWVLDNHHRVLRSNKAAEGFFHRPCCNTVGRPCWETVHGTTEPYPQCPFVRARTSGHRERMELQEGDRWFQVVVDPIRDAQGQQVGAVHLVSDITEHKRAEEQLREQATLLDAANDAIYVRLLDHTVIYWNAGAARLYGWASTEAMGRKVTELGLVETAAFATAQTDLLAQGHWTGEMKKTGKDGKVRTVFCRWTLLRGERGQPKEVLAINTDVTEKKQLEAQYLRAQRMEGIGMLAGGIAHDLNNILTPILMSTSLLRGAVRDSEHRLILDSMEACARRGADVIRQLLTFARGQPGVRAPVPMRHLLGEMSILIRETFPRNLRLSVAVPRELWPVLGDPTQVHQALMNLCVNARDAMPDGGSLTLAAENLTLDETSASLTPDAKPGPFVRVRVTDTGIGIPAGQLDRIFDPFFTTKEIGKGTGLGLATVLGVVRGHGGFVRVDSKVGQGTTFELCLPASPEMKTADAPKRLLLPHGHGESILVVDDEATVRGTAEQVLVQFGYRVLVAAEGAEALALFARHRTEIKAVLTDMMMPGMDGPKLVRALWQLDARLPILGMTGLVERTAVKGLEGLDSLPLLAKPFEVEKLLLALHQVLTAKIS